MDFAYASPLDRTQILLRDLNDVLLRTGAVDVAIPDGSGLPPDQQTGVGVRVIDRLPSGPIPTWDLFELVASTTECTPRNYYTELRSYLYDPVLTVVNETIVCEQIPIDDLLVEKRREILVQDDTVRYSSANTALVANWWIVCDQRARSEWTSIAAALAARTQEIVEGTRNVANWYPGGPNQPRMQILNANTLEIRREPPTKDQYLELAEDLGVHTNETGNATNSAMQAAEALHTANDWQGLADLDPADAAWGYPTHVPLP